jgi:hypothetical protein
VLAGGRFKQVRLLTTPDRAAGPPETNDRNVAGCLYFSLCFPFLYFDSRHKSGFPFLVPRDTTQSVHPQQRMGEQLTEERPQAKMEELVDRISLLMPAYDADVGRKVFDDILPVLRRDGGV